jgi:hypothetical protein
MEGREVGACGGKEKDKGLKENGSGGGIVSRKYQINL